MAVSQVRKTERLSVALTAEEKQAVLTVAAALGEKDHSLLLRGMSLEEIMARAKSIKKVLAER